MFFLLRRKWQKFLKKKLHFTPPTGKNFLVPGVGIPDPAPFSSINHLIKQKIIHVVESQINLGVSQPTALGGKPQRKSPRVARPAWQTPIAAARCSAAGGTAGRPAPGTGCRRTCRALCCRGRGREGTSDARPEHIQDTTQENYFCMNISLFFFFCFFFFP